MRKLRLWLARTFRACRDRLARCASQTARLAVCLYHDLKCGMAVLRRGAELAKQKTKRSLRRWRTRFVLAKLALLEAGYILAHPRMWPEIYRRRKRRWQAFRKEARQIWRWFYQILKLYFRSEERYYAYGMVFLLVACMLAINHANVINNELQGEIQTTAASKEVHEFWTSVAKLIGLFVISTPLVVFYQWYQDKFEINWRAWLFRFYIDKWTENQNHYRMRFNSKVDNPEERLTQTLADYTSTINNLFNTTFAAVVALISFVYIVWHISPKLLLIALGYTMLVTLFNIAIGRKLFRLRFSQRKKEADNRYTLTRVRDHVESIAFYRGEAKENATIKQRFLWVVTNYNLLIGWQRNMGVVKQIYDYANTLLPWLIIPQLYFLGLVKFGAISQGSDALGQVLAALSLVIANWDDLTDFFAIVRRLGEFHDAVTNPPEEPPTSVTTVESDHVEFDDVTANSPSHKALARHICFALAAGQSLLIVGASGTGKTTVFRMLMGLSRSGSGRILRPPLEKFDFLPQNPYMPLGTLRDQLTYPAIDRQITDAQLKAALAVVGLETLPDRFVDKGGFDAVEIWEQVLSPGMQQRLSFLRVMLSDRPNVCLDEATSALDEKNENRIYQLLRDKKKTFISVGHRRTLVKHHDFVLELSGDEQSRLYTQAQYKEKLALDEARDDDEPSP